jgi:hypothetical protein
VLKADDPRVRVCGPFLGRLHLLGVGARALATDVGVGALLATAPPPFTDITRQTPVTADAQIAPGFAVTETAASAHCGEGSDIGTAYRCFSGNGVYDPCYAIAEPGTGDGTSVVCPRSAFSTELFAISAVTGLGRIEDNAFDEPNGLVLTSGARCTASQDAHSAIPSGRVIDYYCDDDKTAVLRDLHKGRIWRADVVTYDKGFTYSSPAVWAIARVVLLQHDVPPANRPVTDTGNATSDDLDSPTRVHHEVDCGEDSTTSSGRIREQTFTSGAPCYEATLIVTEWDNNGALEPGWVCSYSDGDTLLCKEERACRFQRPAWFLCRDAPARRPPLTGQPASGSSSRVLPATDERPQLPAARAVRSLPRGCRSGHAYLRPVTGRWPRRRNASGPWFNAKP